MIAEFQIPGSHPVRMRRRVVRTAAALLLMVTALVPVGGGAATRSAGAADPPGAAMVVAGMGGYVANGTSRPRINDAGVIAFEATGGGAARWSAGSGLELLGTVDGASSATDINNHGVIVGSYHPSSGSPGVFRWTEEHALEDLGTVPGQSEISNVLINDSGLIIVETIDDAASSSAASKNVFRWSADDGFSRIDALSGRRAIVRDMNDHGVVVGYAYDGYTGAGDSPTSYGWMWSEAGGVDIVPTGSSMTQPQAVSDTGVISGTMYSVDRLPSGVLERGIFRWSQAGGTEFLSGPLEDANGASGAFATDATEDGAIIGWDLMPGGATAAFIWDDGFRILDAPDGMLPWAIDVNENIVGVADGTVYLVPGEVTPQVGLGGAFFGVNNAPPNVKVDETMDVRLRVENTSSRPVTELRLTSIRVEPGEHGSGGDALLVQTSALSPTTLGTTSVETLAFADLQLTGVAEGEVRLVAEVEGSVDGVPVAATIEGSFDVFLDELGVELELDPPDYDVPEDGAHEPVEITATVRFTNNTPDDMTDVRLESLDIARAHATQAPVDHERLSGVHPDPISPAVLVPHLASGATSEDFEAVFRLAEPATIDVVAVGTAVRGGQTNAIKRVTARWRPRVTKFVEVRTEMVTPQVGELIPAGEDVVIDGTVENLTSDYEVTLGPLWPEVAGNVGEMSFAYGGQAPDPADAVPVEPVELAPGEILRFQVRFSTAYSDAGPDGPVASGGTRAIAVFEPWGHAEQLWNPDDDGAPERVEIRTYGEARPSSPQQVGEEPDAQVRADTADLHRVISVDDSVEMPAREWWRLGTVAAIGRGGITGAVNMVIATLRALPDLVGFAVKAPGMLVELSAKVWDSFEEWERDEFTRSVSFLVVSVLLRSAEFSYEAAGDLYDAVDEMTAEFLDKNMQDFYAGDFEGAVENMTAASSEAILSVLAPVALSKLAKSPKVAAKLDQWQARVNAEAALMGEAVQGFRVVQDALPMLRAIRSGAEPTFEMIKKLWGISQREIAEYQRICKQIGCIATVRSRHASSLEWIQKWKAVLKPERLKIKSVSDLDVFLGYDVDDIGSLIFRKPEILTDVSLPDTLAARKAFLKNDANVAMLESKAEQFVRSKGLQPGQPGYDEAVKRLGNRTEEWIKHELDYKKMHDRKWIDVDFNYGDNMIPEYKFDAAGNIVGDLSQAEKVKTRGFELERRRIGEQGVTTEEYVVKMQDQSGKYRRITGDIDPVDFTYVDGSPLSGVDLARLTHELQNSFLGAEHGYTATFRGYFDPMTGKWSPKPGPELVLKQFKPGEAGLQIKPDAPSRAVRLNVERSQWNSPRDYRLQWDGGHTDIGMAHPRGTPRPLDLSFDEMQALPGVNLPLPVRADPFVPTLGRMVVEVGTGAGDVGLIIGANGQLQKVLPDGTTEDTDLHDEVFAEGDVEEIGITPQTQLGAPITGDPGAVLPGPMAGPGSRTKPLRSSAGTRQAPVPGTRITIDTGDGFVTGDFEAGQVVAVGVGTDGVETRRVVAIGDGWLQVDVPFFHDHDAGEIVMMTVAADVTPVTIDDDGDRSSEPPPNGFGDGPDGATDDGSAGSGAGDVVATQPRVGHDGALPATGTRAGQLVPLGVVLVFLGVVFTAVTTRRPRRRRT